MTVTIRYCAPYRPTSAQLLVTPTTSTSAAMMSAWESWMAQTVLPRLTRIVVNRRLNRGRGSRYVRR